MCKEKGNRNLFVASDFFIIFGGELAGGYGAWQCSGVLPSSVSRVTLGGTQSTLYDG